MLSAALAAGCDRDTLLAEAGLAPALLDGHTRLLPVQFANLMRAIWRQTGDEFMGLTAQPSRVGTFPLMMHAVLSADSLGEALRHGAHFYRVLSDDIQLRLLTGDDGQAALRLQLRHPERDRQHVLSETILLCWYRLACWLINRRIHLHSTHFDYPAPAHVAEYHQLYPCPHRFEQPHTELRFDAGLLDLPVTRTREELKRLIRELPLGFFVKPVFEGSWGHRVRSQLLRTDAPAWPDLETVAAALYVTGRTLRRKLDAEGTSFQLIKDDLRRDQAMALLRQSSLGLQAVALQVGFREATVFIKAFRQWTGTTPGDYRARLKARRQARGQGRPATAGSGVGAHEAADGR